jgi:hypothetical protein
VEMLLGVAAAMSTSTASTENSDEIV